MDEQPAKLYGMHPANLLLAVIGCTLIAGLCAVTVFLTADFILNSIQSANMMVLLITDEPGKTFVSDDKNLEANLNSAKQALLTCRDIALALGVGCCMITAALGWKLTVGRLTTKA
jgi:DMSO reductase anchor subunit